MYADAYLKPSRTSGEPVREKYKQPFIIDVRISSKYASGITFIVEKVIVSVNFVRIIEKFVIDSRINKKHDDSTFFMAVVNFWIKAE